MTYLCGAFLSLTLKGKCLQEIFCFLLDMGQSGRAWFRTSCRDTKTDNEESSRWLIPVSVRNFQECQAFGRLE